MATPRVPLRSSLHPSQSRICSTSASTALSSGSCLRRRDAGRRLATRTRHPPGVASDGADRRRRGRHRHRRLAGILGQISQFGFVDHRSSCSLDLLRQGLLAHVKCRLRGDRCARGEGPHMGFSGGVSGGGRSGSELSAEAVGWIGWAVGLRTSTAWSWSAGLGSRRGWWSVVLGASWAGVLHCAVAARRFWRGPLTLAPPSFGGDAGNRRGGRCAVHGSC
jgi:hypothetical protein